MRVAIVVAVACLSAVGLCAGQDVKASIRKSTNIPAQELVSALKMLARDRGFQLVFRSEVVGAKQTQGAVGELTTTEALTRLLEGTNLVYSYLDEKTVTILPGKSNDKPDGPNPAAGKSQQCSGISGCAPEALARHQLFASVMASAGAGSVPNGKEGFSPNKDSAESPVLEEIIVTAQKRQERLLDVPMSISAVTGEALAKEGATTLGEIASTVPGLSTLEYSPGQARTQLRGISAAAGSPTIGLYLDEIPINVDSTQQGADIRFLDLERVEVLRGPQGTLYGEGSMGGTIKFVTHDPDLHQTSFGFDGAFGTISHGSNLWRANAVINAPVVEDTFALRLVGGYERSPGWIDYPRIGAIGVNSGASTTGRLKALWKVSDAFRATVTLVYQHSDYNSQNFADASRSAPYVMLQPYEDKNRIANLLLVYDAPGFSVLSSTSYMKRDVASTFDVSQFFVPVYIAPPPFGFGLPAQSVHSVALLEDNSYRATSEELRISSRSQGPLKWLAGAYYRDYGERGGSNSVTTPNPFPFQLLVAEVERDSKQWALFGEATYDITSRFDTTMGLRYFSDQRDKSGSGANLGMSSPEPYEQKTFTSVDPRFVFSYHATSDALIYTSAAKGFRSGGFNLIASRPPGCNLPDAFDPEDLWTYEVGSNLALDNNKVIVQGAVYHNAWKNIQVYVFCPGGQSTQFTNAGKASGTGVDFQLTARPVSALTLALAGSYNDSQYDDNSASHNKGDRIDFVPKYQGSVSADLDFHWSAALPGRVHLDYQYAGSFSIALRNYLGSAPIASSDSYARLNARVSVLTGSWELALFGTNVTDTNKVVMPPLGAVLVPVSMQPRTIGLGIRYNYN